VKKINLKQTAHQSAAELKFRGAGRVGRAQLTGWLFEKQSWLDWLQLRREQLTGWLWMLIMDADYGC
jgi:hypothetical protein